MSVTLLNRDAAEKIFILGGAPLPISDTSLQGEQQVLQLELAFAEKMGLDPVAMRPNNLTRTLGTGEVIDVDEW